MSSLAIIKKVRKELTKTDGVYILITKSKDYLSVKYAAIKCLTKDKRFFGIYVSLNKSCIAITDELKEAKIDPQKILFIDGTGEGTTTSKKCIALKSSQSLTELSLAMTEACKNKALKFIFFDSLSTLLIFNGQETTERFMHYLINKMRNMGIILIILSLEEERSNKLIPTLSQSCDKVIKM